MEFRVPCECGEVHSVTEGSAGQKLPCRCGRIVTIPKLRELQALAGIGPKLAPDFVVEQLLLAGKLPEEEYCVSCGTPTDCLTHVVVDCERARVVQTGRSLIWYIPLYFISPLLALFAKAEEGPRQTVEYGKDKIYSLPLRLCERCKEHMIAAKAARDLLHLVPVYHRLLVKYPMAKVHEAE